MVPTQLQDVAGGMSLLILMTKAANPTNKDNNVPEVYFTHDSRISECDHK